MSQATLQRPAADEYHEFYGGYVRMVPEGDLLEILDRQTHDVIELLRGVPPGQTTVHHAPYTWTLKEVVGHLIDAERVMAYRALRIARGDPTPLPGYDENAYVASAGFNRFDWGDLVDHFAIVRRGSMALLRRFGPTEWSRRGTANDSPVTVRALGYIIAGHTAHHMAIIRRRLMKKVSGTDLAD